MTETFDAYLYYRMSIAAAEDDREECSVKLESRIDSQHSSIVELPHGQSEIKSDLKEQKKTLDDLQVKARNLLDHSRAAYEKSNAKDKVMETILSEMTQVNVKISLVLARSDSPVVELSNTLDENSSILGFTTNILKRLGTDAMTTLSLALLLSNTYKASVSFLMSVTIQSRGRCLLIIS